MTGRRWYLLTLSALSVGCLLLAQSALAAPATIAFLGSDSDATDYSNSGLNYGNLGHWFANFGTSPLETGQPVEQNEANNLPTWATLIHDPNDANYSWSNVEDNIGPPPFTPTVTSTGGNAAFNTLTLPNGSSGTSGQAIDGAEAGNLGQSNNIVSHLLLGPGTPPGFILRTVVDNEDSGTPSAVRRVKARLATDAILGVLPNTEADTGNGIDGTRNNIADVHSFAYRFVKDGMILRIQLRTSNTPGASALGAGMAGFMFDVVPEPSSLALLGLGTVGLGCVRRRRR